MTSSNGEKASSKDVKESSLKSFLAKLRKRHIIETFAGFIAGGWLLVEVVERLLVGHYHFPEETIDLTVVSAVGALLSALIWRWFRGTEKRPGNVRVEVLLVPLIILATLAIDLNLIFQIAGVSSQRLLIGIIALCLGIAWIVFKSLRWAAIASDPGRKEPELFSPVAAPGVAASPRIPSLAVLPFANLSGDKENEYFSDGLAEDIIDALTQVDGLRVMARTSAFAFRGKEQDVREIGARLNVEHILEGSVRRSGTRIRVSAQLVKASDGYHLWSQHFDREMKDIFAIQDEISQAIVEKLRVRLAGGSPLVKGHTENLAAYDLCLKARYHIFKLTQEGREAGRRYCEQAIALDPNYALAYVVLAESYFWSAFWGSTDPREGFPGAKSAALQALRLDDTIADAHSALGSVLAAGEYDWLGAEREFRRAKELSPSSAAVGYDYHWWYAMYFLLPLGRVEEALIEMRRGLDRDPLDPFYNSLLGYLLYASRQFDPALVQLRHTIDLDPTFFFAHWFLSLLYACEGRLDEAIAAAEKANELSGANAITLGNLGKVYGLAGRTEAARQLLEELTQRQRSTYVPAYAFLALHSGLSERDQALEWMARGVEEHDPIMMTSLRISPSYDTVRSHPAYKALLRKMNLEP
jgi:TolB-like protein/tetratricopeptide (TPR) repeat protein